MTTGATLTPNQSTHPGLLIKDELAARHLKQVQLANETGIQPTQLNELIKCKKPISYEQAFLIAAALPGVSARHLITLQTNYDLHEFEIQRELKDKVKAIEQWQQIKEVVDISYFRKENILSSGRVTTDIERLLTALDFKSVTQLISELEKNTPNGIHFRKSGMLKEHKPYVNSWIRYVKHISASQKVAVFDPSCKDELLQSLRKVFLATNVQYNLANTLKKYGIKLVIKHKPDKTPLDGAAFWHENRPVIGLTLRHSRYDNFLFTVFHELGHIFLHFNDKENRETGFVDSLEDTDINYTSSKEAEANTFAKNTLVPADKWDEFTRNKDKGHYSDTYIEKFAKSISVPAQSVLGRLCHEEKMDYKCNSIYKKNNFIP